MREVIDIENLGYSRKNFGAQIIYDAEMAKSKIEEYTEMVTLEEEKVNKRNKIVCVIAFSVIILICFNFLCFISGAVMTVYWPEILAVRILLIFIGSLVFCAIYYFIEAVFEKSEVFKVHFIKKYTNEPADFYSGNERFYTAFAEFDRIIKIDLVRRLNRTHILDFRVANADGIVKECSVDLGEVKILKQLDSDKIVIDLIQAQILIPYKTT